MTAKSANIDWNELVALVARDCREHWTKSELTNLIRALLKCEKEIFDEDDDCAQFFTAFATLAALKLSQCNFICQTQLPQLQDACALLVRYLLQRLNRSNSNSEIKWVLGALKALVHEPKPQITTSDFEDNGNDAQISAVGNIDCDAVINALKSARLPEFKKQAATGAGSSNNNNNNDGGGGGAGEVESPRADVKRSRSDLSSLIVHQLRAPLESGQVSWVSLSEDTADCNAALFRANGKCFRDHNGVDRLLDACLGLSSISRYRPKYEEAVHRGKPLFLPLNQQEASQSKASLASVQSDLEVFAEALDIIVIEPLTPNRTEKLHICAMVTLYHAVLSSTAVSVLNMQNAAKTQSGNTTSSTSGSVVGSNQSAAKESDECEELASSVLKLSIELYNATSTFFKNTARSHIYYNHVCYGAWLLITGMYGAMGASGSNFESGRPSKTAELQSAARVNLLKVQQGFGVLNAAVAKESIKLLTELIQDLKIDYAVASMNVTLSKAPQAADFDILQNYTSLQRLIRILDIATIHQVYTLLAALLYRKACNLKGTNVKDRSDVDPVSYSDSTTYFNDSISCSDNSEEDESESYLGDWIKDTLAPESCEESATKLGSKSSGEQKATLVSKPSEPHEYLDLATDIFRFLDMFLTQNNAHLLNYIKTGLSDQQLVLIANIIKDFDRDVVRSDNERTSAYELWSTSQIRFSGSVGRYLHNLISAQLVSEQLQSNLLRNLGVSPWNAETNNWPLQVYPSTLSVLSQILLLKPAQEKEAACLAVWQRVINTLVEGTCATSTVLTPSDADYDDLNIEHAQLLLFLFHALNLMQKKSILLLTAGGIIRCAAICRDITADKPIRNSQIMLLSRLLLFLDYFIKNLYDAPSELLNQVRWNLFGLSSMSPSDKFNDLLNTKEKLTSYCVSVIEEKLRKTGGHFATNIHPTFYSMTAVSQEPLWRHDFELDGLAYNFLLCTPEKIDYALLLESLTDILSITDVPLNEKHNSHKLCAMQFCFSICWKLLHGMPPVISQVQKLLEDRVPNMHSLLWSIRLIRPSLGMDPAIMNSLIKQGMEPEKAQTLISQAVERVAEYQFCVKQALLGIKNVLGKIDKNNPRLSHIIFLDALLVYVEAFASVESDAFKESHNINSCSESGSNSPVPPSSASPDLTCQDPMVYSSNESIELKYPRNERSSVTTTTQDAEQLERTQLNKDLLHLLVDTYALLQDLVLGSSLKQLTGEASEAWLAQVLPISSGKNHVTKPLYEVVLRLVSQDDSEKVKNEWPQSLALNEMAAHKRESIDEYTFTVIEAHISEFTRSTRYMPLKSVKHCLKSAIKLITALLGICRDPAPVPGLQDTLKPLLRSAIFDARLDYVHSNCQNCLSAFPAEGSDEIQKNIVRTYEFFVGNCYRVINNLSDELRIPRNSVYNEPTLLGIVGLFSEQLMGSGSAIKGIHRFFKVKRSGSLVELLLSFAGTALSTRYAGAVLDFVDKLIQHSQKPVNYFPEEDLLTCFSEIGKQDIGRIKLWLSHIIYGPSNNCGQSAVISSADLVDTCRTPSSNAQTPTNISDRLVQSSDAMEIDYDGVSAAQSDYVINLWQTPIAAVTHSADTSKAVDSVNRQNGALLYKIIVYLVRENRTPPTVAHTLFQAFLLLGQSLVSPTQEASDFADVLQIMITLADAMPGRDHPALFSASVSWFDMVKSQLSEKSGSFKQRCNTDNVTALLRYLSELLQSLGYRGAKQQLPPWDDDDTVGGGDETGDDANADGNGDEDSPAEDSDEDALNSKLCTFSMTQKEFMNQHWYHCHTCNMVNTVGVCSICARVCHKNHDVSYSKYGNFFCDCGAKEDGSCQALNRRATGNEHGHDHGPANYVTNISVLGNNKKRTTATFAGYSGAMVTRKDSVINERIMKFAKVLEPHRDIIQNSDHWPLVVRCILELFEVFMSSIRENCAMYSIVGCQKRSATALSQLHQCNQVCEATDAIFVATVGVPEGTIENVRLTNGGDQAQTIKQLISSNAIRRNVLCCRTSPHSRRQHLVVCQDKGKISNMQLSFLLKHTEVTKRKITMAQMSTTPLNCTPISVTANTSNDELVAICGIRECNVLAFNSTGSVSNHITLTPQLENGNYIKKAIWLPGSQTMLAIVTADYVKIYDLAEDVMSPNFYYLVAVGKISDCTFIYNSGSGRHYMLLMASSGYIYSQELDSASRATHGDFYVTNTLEFGHPLVKESNGLIGGGGSSIYYSHALQMLFVGFFSARSFAASLVDVSEGIRNILPLETFSSAPKSSPKTQGHILTQWFEILGHPGLVCGLVQNSNNCMIFMLTPDRVFVQEIKTPSTKMRILDVVGVRHNTADVDRTTLLILFDDGSLRMYLARSELCNFWLTPEIQPYGNQLHASTLAVKPQVTSRRSKRKFGQQQQQKTNSNAVAASTPPIDFFEHCQIMPDVEFGGDDFLQVYNKQKLKARLISNGMYISSAIANESTLEIINNDNNLVIVGVRVLLGSQEVMRAPQYVAVYGRRIPTTMTRARWFDIPLTKEESLLSEKSLQVRFGKSRDNEGIAFIDNVEVYGKTKDAFGWPDDTDDSNAPGTAAGGSSVGNMPPSNGDTAYGEAIAAVNQMDKMIAQLLEVLDCSLSLLNGTCGINSTVKQRAIKAATSLLLLPTPNAVQAQARYVLATLFGNKAAYHAYKDKEMLTYVHNELQNMKPQMESVEAMQHVDPEAFYRLLLMVRSIANARPQSLSKICQENKFHILDNLMEFVVNLFKITPHPDDPPSIVHRGLSHPETAVHCLVEIMYAFAFSECEQVATITKYLMLLLNNEDETISHSAKEAVILLLSPRLKRRKVAIITPPTCSTPPPTVPASTGTTATALTSSTLNALAAANAAASAASGIIEAAAAAAGGDAAGGAATPPNNLLLEQLAQPGGAQQLLNLESLMNMGQLPRLLGLPDDGDEDAIMDIALALSMQDNEGDDIALQALDHYTHMRGLREGEGEVNVNVPNADVMGGNVAGASGVGSDDDEASNVATEGSTMRTPPAEGAAGSGGSESGGSGVESFGGTSARSSTFDDNTNIAVTSPRIAGEGESRKIFLDDDQPCTSRAALAAMGSADSSSSSECEKQRKLHDLRLSILEGILDNVAMLQNCNGLRAIPLVQVILMLTTDLNGNSPRDQKIFNDLLSKVINLIEIGVPTIPSKLIEKDDKNEVRVILLALIGVLMGKTRSKQSGTTSPPHQFKDNTSFVATTTANVLNKCGTLKFCLEALDAMLQYWKRAMGESSRHMPGTVVAPNNIATATTASIQNQLIKPARHGIQPNVATLIPSAYASSYPHIFDMYESFATDLMLRLPYQILRLSATATSPDSYEKFCEAMIYNLCEFAMTISSHPQLKRQVRKLLLFICGSKEKFRMYRDGHALDSHFNVVKRICNLNVSKNKIAPYNTNVPVLAYDSLVEFTEHLRACQEIANSRTGNWQKFCLIHEEVFSILIEIACYQLDDGVSPIILQLLQAAVCPVVMAPKAQQATSASSLGTLKLRTDRDKSEDLDSNHDSAFDPKHCASFVYQIFRYVSDDLLKKFVRIYLLEANVASLRWQAHTFVHAIYESSNDQQKEKLLNIFWDMWPLVSLYGKRTAQFVDLLGYLTLSTESIRERLPDYTGKAVEVLRQQNNFLTKHPNMPIYNVVESVLQVNGYYLESEPCLVCNNPEVPMTNIKLTSIRSDSKFTTTSMIFKLLQCHTISKLNIRISDIKRARMVRTINVYYNNRTVQAVVELKNKPNLWNRARTQTILNNQSDVKIDFPLPITACNLMIEFSDFYESTSTFSESLQCPRCSTTVAAYPGMCTNCGESVMQCHKCRAINYDDRDPFLCHSCGFCKYAKFEFGVFGRVCSAVDPIETTEDRAKAVQAIHTSLDRADRVYRQLQTLRQTVEILCQRVCEQRTVERVALDDQLSSTSHAATQINRTIQTLSQKYCLDARASFEELSKIAQKVRAYRAELVAYDRRQLIDQDVATHDVGVPGQTYTINRCYGCALASVEQCLILLRAMSWSADCRLVLHSQGLVQELTERNLRRGTQHIQEKTRNLLVYLTKNNEEACISLLNLIGSHVKGVLKGALPLTHVEAALSQEVHLLEMLIIQDDFCWERKLRVAFEIFIVNCNLPRGALPTVLQSCFRVMQTLLDPPSAISKQNTNLSAEDLASILTEDSNTIDYYAWLAERPGNDFNGWLRRMPANNRPPTGKLSQQSSSSLPEALVSDGQNSPESQRRKFSEAHERLIAEKYLRRWRRLARSGDAKTQALCFRATWIHSLIFNSNSRFCRQLASAMIIKMANKYERRCQMINLLTGLLKYVGEVGEAAAEFISVYQQLSNDQPWLQYLALKGVLTIITDLLAVEIEKVHKFEMTTLSSDLSQGYALKQYVDLLAMFLNNNEIRRTYKCHILSAILENYLALRRLVIQRTRMIDDAQAKLLQMLEDMTSGTEEEKRNFMNILVETVQKTRPNDIQTPVFIFERLYSIIHPEIVDETEFFITLEKDPQQEDFLQGRMVNNPYSSNFAGMGPLMRDIKNKICTDCEMVALLEDDNGMELLVQNKIISLDLPVKEVQKKVWVAGGGERESMRIVYRMRGLMGDATEEFIETFTNKSEEEIDNEELYGKANELAEGKAEGLKVMLDQLEGLQNLTRCRELLQVLLKLFCICIKISKCQEVLCKPELGAIGTLLKVLQLCLNSGNDSIQPSVTEQLLEIMETILSKAASDTLESFLQFSQTFGGPEYVTALLSCINNPNVRRNPSVLRHLIRVLAALVYGNETKMERLCEHFKDVSDFERFDGEHTDEQEFRLETFCVLTNQIEHNCIGNTLKDYIISLDIVDKALKYVADHAPCVKPTLMRDSDELKQFISLPSLKYILRFLTGLAAHHQATQLAISKTTIPIIHRLEQVSSDEHVGSLAENLLEALCTDEQTAARVQQVRESTRAEKKRLAMATREKQLNALGMRTNEKGQVTAKTSILNIEKLREETGLTCFICREGYACQPEKVLGIYTFTKRCNVEEFDLKGSRKATGYTTVTHFNVVHFDCHSSAIRSTARGRDEWERASLHNANTRCNGLLPLWGPNVSEQAFTGCMNRHSTHMQDCTQRGDITYANSVHDLKLLLARFAWERTFHEDAGGGGPESNMHFVPYLLSYALYLLSSLRLTTRETQAVQTYQNVQPGEKWFESAYEPDGPLFMLVSSLCVQSREMWNAHRLTHLKRLITIAQVRQISPKKVCKTLSAQNRQPLDYSVYKPYLLMWALVDKMYNMLFNSVAAPKEEDWSSSLFDYIRRSDELMLKATDSILLDLTSELLPCTTFEEFWDVAGLYSESEAEGFIENVLAALPSTT